MGVLEDAIREHLELKRRHGVAEEEVRRQEAEALGPARRESEGRGREEHEAPEPEPLDREAHEASAETRVVEREDRVAAPEDATAVLLQDELEEPEPDAVPVEESLSDEVHREESLGDEGAPPRDSPARPAPREAGEPAPQDKRDAIDEEREAASFEESEEIREDDRLRPERRSSQDFDFE